MEKEDIRERRKMASDAIMYSSQRMDFLIITISGAGIYVVLETLKYFLGIEDKPCLLCIKLSGVLFCLSIIVNFISQITSRISNYNDYISSNARVNSIDSPSEQQIADISKFETKANVYDNATGILNTSSTILMLLGLIILVSFFLFTF